MSNKNDPKDRPAAAADIVAKARSNGPIPLPPAARIRVLIADDHPVVRDGLAAIIGCQSDMVVVAEAGNGREAVNLWRQHRPDVTLLDLRMPDLDGVGVIENLRAVDAAARTILLTSFDSDEDIYRGMRAGAKAYLLKDARREDLLDCIRRVHGGELFIPPAIAAKLASRVGGMELTNREIEALRLLASGKSNKEIAQDLGITESTVKSHVKSIFTKLDVISRTEAIAAALRRGLVQF
jgi:DNA-binding NarL/FixJ family response regulator